MLEIGHKNEQVPALEGLTVTERRSKVDRHNLGTGSHIQENHLEA